METPAFSGAGTFLRGKADFLQKALDKIIQGGGIIMSRPPLQGMRGRAKRM